MREIVVSKGIHISYSFFRLLPIQRAGRIEISPKTRKNVRFVRFTPPPPEHMFLFVVQIEEQRYRGFHAGRGDFVRVIAIQFPECSFLIFVRDRSGHRFVEEPVMFALARCRRQGGDGRNRQDWRSLVAMDREPAAKRLCTGVIITHLDRGMYPILDAGMRSSGLFETTPTCLVPH